MKTYEIEVTNASPFTIEAQSFSVHEGVCVFVDGQGYLVAALHVSGLIYARLAASQ